MSIAAIGGGQRLTRLKVIVFCAATVCIAEGRTAAIDSAMACLARGEVERARDLFSAALVQEPENPAITLLYAQSLDDPQEAKELYLELTNAVSASDSIKAAAHARLGALAYAAGDYDEAVEHYEAACEKAFLCDCAAVLPRARRLQQHHLPHTQKYRRADALPETRFSIQIGSYAVRENAERQRLSLEEAKVGEPVRIVEADVDGKKVYRVRVGTFPSRDQAQAFARRNLRPKNIPFSVVVQ